MMELHCCKHCIINVSTEVACGSSFHRCSFGLLPEFHLYTCTISGNRSVGCQEREQMKNSLDLSKSCRSCLLHCLVQILENSLQSLRISCDGARISFDNCSVCLTSILHLGQANLPVLLVMILILPELPPCPIRELCLHYLPTAGCAGPVQGT